MPSSVTHTLQLDSSVAFHRHDGSAQVSLSTSAKTDLSRMQAAPVCPHIMKKGSIKSRDSPNRVRGGKSGSSHSHGEPTTRTDTLEEKKSTVEEALEFGEEIITFDSPIHAYDPSETALAMAGRSSSFSGGGSGQQGVRKRKSVKSEDSIELHGPMEVDGSVKSMGAVTFTGNFSVRDRIEAYGDITVNGNLTCRYAIPKRRHSIECGQDIH